MAITGNASYIFASNHSDFRRFNRTTNNVDGSNVNTGGKVWGLAADANRLFVGTDASGGRIKVYNPSTNAFVSEWVFARAGRMSVDSAGDLWVIQRADANNAARVAKNGTWNVPEVGNPTSSDPWDMWIWRDTDTDGQFDSNEFTTYRPDNPYMFGWNVDSAGNIWKGLRESGIRKLNLSVDANGIPTFTPQTIVANPAPFNSASNGDIRRVHYDAATDVMYISGFNNNNVGGGSTGNDDRGAGRLVARFANWSTGNRTASHTVQLPYNFDFANVWTNHYTPESIDVAGNDMFVGYFDPGATRIRVYNTADLSYVGEI